MSLLIVAIPYSSLETKSRLIVLIWRIHDYQIWRIHVWSIWCIQLSLLIVAIPYSSLETRSRLEYQIWRIHIWSIFEADDAFTCKAWHIHLWDMTHFYTRHDTSIHQTCFTCPTQSIMYVPLQVNRFQKIVLLVVQYKYLKSCSRRFNSPESDPPHKIMRYDVYSSPQLCCWFPRQKSVRWKWFVLAVYHVLKRHFGGAGP